MKPPVPPPPFRELAEEAREDLASILEAGIGLLPKGKYRHWDNLRHLEPPSDFSHRQWWLGVKLARRGQYRTTPLTDKTGKPFVYTLPDPVLARLHALDQRAGGRIGMAETVVNPETRNRYIINSLMEEAITSSQLEGASTTRQVAADMIREGRAPRDKHERMILNNYQAMAAIRDIQDEPLTVDRVLALHHQLTEDTLDNPNAAGRLQTPEEERVTVADNTTGRVAHVPPPAEELPERMEALVNFANAEGEGEGQFIHPVIRGIVLHFWLAFDHPFEDGNGRVARALFYWVMLHQGYWLFEFVSLSSVIKEAPAQYARAFLETETDDNDLTYFIINQLQSIERAVAHLETYLERKAQQVQRVEELLYNRADLNDRQLALLSHAIRHPGHRYTTQSHRRSHAVAYATARSDLLGLAELGLLDKRRAGKGYSFRAPSDLEDRIRGLS